MRRAVGLPERDGLLVRAVQDGSPAERAGLEVGDLLVRAGEQPLELGRDRLLARIEKRVHPRFSLHPEARGTGDLDAGQPPL